MNERYRWLTLSVNRYPLSVVKREGDYNLANTPLLKSLAHG